MINSQLKKIIISAVVAAGGIFATAADLKLVYDRPANYFEESLVIGNGRLGGIVYGGISTDSISLNDITLWTGEPVGRQDRPDCRPLIAEIRKALDAENYALAESLQQKLQGGFSQNYQPLGKLKITYSNADTTVAYRRTLDLATALATVSAGTRTTEYFASAPDSVIVVRITDPVGVDAVIELGSLLPTEVKAGNNRIVADGYAAYHSLPVYRDEKEKFFYDPNRGIHFRTIVNLVAPGATVMAKDGKLHVKGTKEAVLLITNATSFNGFDKNPVAQGRPYPKLADARIANASGFSYDVLRKRASDWHGRMFGRVTLDLGSTDPSISSLTTDRQLLSYADNNDSNPDLEELYFQYGRYLLISSSQTPGVPANLQGLWNEKMLPPWSSNYTTNINLEENYWGAETTSLPELHDCLLDFIQNLAINGNKSAKDYCGVDSGWSLGHNTDIWAMTNPVGLGDSSPSWANWSMGSTWLATHIWENYLFGRDKDRLRHYYPALKGAARFALGLLYERNGELITSPSTSPENMFIAPDGKARSTMHCTTADMALIRECLADARMAAMELGVDSGLVAEIDSVLPRLHPYVVKSDGSLSEWFHEYADEDPHHRHQSHLIGLYPGHHISPRMTPELAAACAKTLEIKGDETTGWSAGWRVNLQARLGSGDKAYKMYRRLLRYVSPDKYRGPGRRKGGGTYPNLLDAHSPFQIDGNFGGSAGVAEMLLQSGPESITLLPALPEAWPEGRVSGLRTRTGHSVSFAWKDGKVTELTLTAPSGVVPATQLTLFANGRQYTLKPSNNKLKLKL